MKKLLLVIILLMTSCAEFQADQKLAKIERLMEQSITAERNGDIDKLEQLYMQIVIEFAELGSIVANTDSATQVKIAFKIAAIESRMQSLERQSRRR